MYTHTLPATVSFCHAAAQSKSVSSLHMDVGILKVYLYPTYNCLSI